MAARARFERAGAGSTTVMTLVFVILMVVMMLGTPAHAADEVAAGTGQTIESTTEVGAATVGPTGAAGLSLLGAAVAASLWGVAVGERQARANRRR